jgi:hypothetical protein
MAIRSLLIALVLALLTAPAALATPSPVALDSGEVALAEANGGGWTTAVGLTNLSNAALAVTARPAVAKVGCAPQLDHSARLPAAQHTIFTVTVPAACDLATKKLALTLTAGNGATATSLPVVAALKAPVPSKPDWGVLWWFLVTLGAGAAVSLAAFVAWDPKGDVHRRLDQALPYVGASWSFGGSWASNVTVVGGLLAGVLGSSDLLKQVLGAAAAGALAVVTIAGAISAALIGAAGIVAITSQTRAKGEFTAGGLLAASAIALGGGGGQLIVVYLVSRDLDLGGGTTEKYLVPGLLFAALALLAIYGYRSLQGVFVRGTTPRPAVGRPRAKKAVRSARRRVKAAAPDLQRSEIDSIVSELDTAEDVLDAPAAAPEPAPVSALP